MMTMKSSLSRLFLHLLLLSSGVSGLGSVLSKHYWYSSAHYTWQEAQSYCRSSNHYIDLATIYTQSDTDQMDMQHYNAWIGFYRQRYTGYSSYYDWIWSNGKYKNSNGWAQSEPDYADTCAYVTYNSERLHGATGGQYFFFICDEIKASKYHYKFIPQSKMWSEARTYCRNEFRDLAAFDDSDKLESAVDENDFPVWIGLHREGQAWKWSTGFSDYTKWASQEPGNNGDCVSISSKSKKMATQDCSARFPFVCYKDNLVLVKENKTWEEALEHCRSLSYELVSVQPGEDYNDVMSRVQAANTEKVWVGLHFLAGHWLWVNGADMLYSDLPLCPLEVQHCGAFSKNDTGSMETTDCLEELNFLCYRTW